MTLPPQQGSNWWSGPFDALGSAASAIGQGIGILPQAALAQGLTD